MVDQVSITGFQKAQTEQYFPLHTTSSEHLQRAPHEHSPKGCSKIILYSTPGHSWQLIGILFTIGALQWYRKFLFVFQFWLIALVTWKRVNQPGSHWGTFPCASVYCPPRVNVKRNVQNGSEAVNTCNNPYNSLFQTPSFILWIPNPGSIGYLKYLLIYTKSWWHWTLLHIGLCVLCQLTFTFTPQVLFKCSIIVLRYVIK